MTQQLWLSWVYMASQTFLPALFPFSVISKNTLWVVLIGWVVWDSQKLFTELVRKFKLVQTWFAIFGLAKYNNFCCRHCVCVAFFWVTLFVYQHSLAFYLMVFSPNSCWFSTKLTIWLFFWVTNLFLGILMSWICPIFPLLNRLGKKSSWKVNSLSVALMHSRGKFQTLWKEEKPKLCSRSSGQSAWLQ